MRLLPNDIAAYGYERESPLLRPSLDSFDEVSADAVSAKAMVDHEPKDFSSSAGLEQVEFGTVDPADDVVVSIDGYEDDIPVALQVTLDTCRNRFFRGGIAQVVRKLGDASGVGRCRVADYNGLAVSTHGLRMESW